MKNSQLSKTWPYRRHNDFEGELRKAAADWFAKRGSTTHPRREYSLKSRDNWPQNIICEDVVSYIRQEVERHLGQRPFPLHNYLHHGLSSQAMTFNLIGPLIVRKDLDPLRICVEAEGLHWPKEPLDIEFEHEDREIFNEDSGQPTSFDVFVAGDAGSVFIESKLVEREFGGCSVFSRGDCDGRNPIRYGLDLCYLHHIGRTYWERATEFGFDKTSLGSGHVCPFANYYQFFREVLFALKRDGSYVLLHDERNPTFLRGSTKGVRLGLWPFLLESVPREYAGRIGRITIQQLVAAIDQSGGHEDWIGEFKIKYGIE